MTITYPLTMPTTPEPAAIRMTARTIVGLSASPFTGQQQVYQHSGEWWESEVTLPPMTRAQAEPWIGFFLALAGRAGTFYLGDAAALSARGIGTGTPLVRYVGNMALQSTDFGASPPWTQSPAADVAVTGDTTTAPDGTNTADKLYEESTGGNWKIIYQNFTGFADSTNYCASIYAKAAERTVFSLAFVRKDGVNSTCFYDLSAGTVGTKSPGATGRITAVGSGWYRCELIVNVLTGGATPQVKIGLAQADNVAVYTGVVGNGIYIWGAQVEEGLGAGTYVPTTTAAVNTAPTGKIITTDGWTASQTGIMKAGDWMQVGSAASQRIYRVMQDVNSDSSGVATMDIFPRLREIPGDNAPFTIASTRGVFRLASNDFGYDVQPHLIYGGFTFAAVEAI